MSIDIVETSNNYGISQELLTISILSKYGTVSIPYGNSARYDCILEINNCYYTIQIKSLNIKEDNDLIIIPMGNCNPITGKPKTYTSEQIDFIAITFNNKVYLFNPDLAARAFSIRINKPENERQHWIEDYHIEKILDINFNDWVSQKEEKRGSDNKNKKKSYSCIKCGGPCSQKNSLCRECYEEEKKIRILNNRPSRDELKQHLINRESFVKIGSYYGVTDNAIRKWCRYYNLPSLARDIKNMSKEELENL